MKATLKGNLIELKFKYSLAAVRYVRSLPARRYHPDRKIWTVPLSEVGREIPEMKRQGFSIDPEIFEAVQGDVRRVKELERLEGRTDTNFKTDLPLYPYQKVGAKFLYEAGSGILGDDVGLGKTIQALAVMEARTTKRNLVFCPAVLKYQWEEEIKKFVPGAKTQVIDGTKADRVKQWQNHEAKYFIINYELLLRDDFELMKVVEWDHITADEATKISNPQAKTSKAIKKLRSRYRLALTGTPISNRPEDVWNIIDFTNPGVLGNYYQFLNRYCIKNQWGSVFSYQNMTELGDRIRRYMIRRMKVDVLKELPPKISTDVPFKLSDKEAELYDKIRKELLFEIEKTDITKVNDPMTIQLTLVKMLRLRQLASSMELLGENVESSKLAVLKELLEEQVNGRKVIIFTMFSKMADILERDLEAYKPLKITGDISDNELRQKIVLQFNEDPKNKVLVMTSAGQFGLNIQGASSIIHYDQEWSLAKMVQREGRAHRLGQTKNVMVYNLLAKGTVDMYVQKVLRAKQKLSDKILMADVRQMLEFGGGKD